MIGVLINATTNIQRNTNLSPKSKVKESKISCQKLHEARAALLDYFFPKL